MCDIEYLWKRDGAAAMMRPSIDRMNSKKDYTLNNCRFVESTKNTRGKDMFRRQSKYERFIGKTFNEMRKEEGVAIVTLYQRIKKYGTYKLPLRALRLPKHYINKDVMNQINARHK